jgi:alkyl hydroperoxide reductase subunit AhpC
VHPVVAGKRYIQSIAFVNGSRYITLNHYFKYRIKLMSLRIGDIAPDFAADTTNGPINFHDWIGDEWAFFFSHPADFTPVCTTEMGRTSQLADQFAARGVKPIGLSTDTVAQHGKWIDH